MFRFVLVASALIACTFAASLNSDAYATGNSDLDIQPDGHYRHNLQTSNGISQQESGLGGVAASGAFSYYSPEGELIQLIYTADENGFQPQGSHLPTPPPIPDAILKSLEYIRTHPQYEEPRQQQQFRAPARNSFKRIVG